MKQSKINKCQHEDNCIYGDLKQIDGKPCYICQCGDCLKHFIIWLEEGDNEDIDNNDLLVESIKLAHERDDVEMFLRNSNYIEREYSENAFDSSMNAWAFAFENRNFVDIKYILKIHKILMKNLNKDIAGKIRKCSVCIGDRFCPYISEDLIKQELKDWCKRYDFIDIKKKGMSNVDLEKIIKMHHIQFELLHPFQDGNGRVGRILMNIERIKVGLPILIIHEGIEQSSYYKWFQNGGGKK